MKGSLTIIGVGSDASQGTMSRAAALALRERLAAARASDRVRLYAGDVPLMRSIPLLRRAALHDLGTFYSTPVVRQRFYRRIAEMILERVERDGFEVVYLCAGNPFVFDDPVGWMRRLARERKIPVKVVPSMSFLDTALGFMGGLDGRGVSVQLCRAVAIGLRELDPHIPTLLAQAGDWSSTGIGVVDAEEPRRRFLEALRERLLRWYPADHPVHLVQATFDEARLGEMNEERTRLSDLPAMKANVWSNLYLPPVEAGRERRRKRRR